MSVASGLFDVVGENVLKVKAEINKTAQQRSKTKPHVRPRHKVIRRILKNTYVWMIHDHIGEVDAGGVFDESKARLASACIPSKGDI